jgi:DNA-binding MarR family transcriptional regulator
MDEKRDLSDHSLSVLISILNRTIDDTVMAGLDAAGFPDLRRSHGLVFEMLDWSGSRITDMAKRARITKQAMGELVTDLEQMGYVERVPDPHDGRAKLVKRTERGQAAVTAAVSALTEMEERWAEFLGEPRFAGLRESLEALCLEFGREHVR